MQIFKLIRFNTTKIGNTTINRFIKKTMLAVNFPNQLLYAPVLEAHRKRWLNSCCHEGSVFVYTVVFSDFK